jgi:hypothetical protein
LDKNNDFDNKIDINKIMSSESNISTNNSAQDRIYNIISLAKQRKKIIDKEKNININIDNNHIHVIEELASRINYLTIKIENIENNQLLSSSSINNKEINKVYLGQLENRILILENKLNDNYINNEELKKQICEENLYDGKIHNLMKRMKEIENNFELEQENSLKILNSLLYQYDININQNNKNGSKFIDRNVKTISNKTSLNNNKSIGMSKFGLKDPINNRIKNYNIRKY